MHRATPLNTSFRAYTSGGARTMIHSIDDGKMMQEMGGNFMKGENRDKVESPQNYGFSSVVRAATKDAQGMIKEAAEGFISFMGGNRSFPVCAIMDDRRFRPLGLKEGENAQYDDLGQMTLMRRAGLFLLSLDGPDDSQKQSGSGAPGQHDGSGGQGQTVQRFVSIRHVEKQKQKRGQQGGGGQGGSSGGSSAGTLAAGADGGQSQGQQDFKHEGESVNTEMRVTKGRIEFRSGDTVVGYYDKQSKTWCFIGKVKLGTESAAHPVYGVNGGLGMTSDGSGSDAVLINAPKPGPPTSMDTKP
jgi:hypothetical protein